MVDQNIEARRACDLERYHRRTAERIARGLCPKCGKQPPTPELSVRASCAEKKRVAGRARDARFRAAGKPRRDRDKARAYERQRYRCQAAERLAAGLCPNCGKQPPAPDAGLCAPCGDQRRAAERARYATSKAAGKLYGGRDPAGGGPVSAVRDEVLRALAMRPRHPGLGPAVHRDRASRGRGLRDL